MKKILMILFIILVTVFATTACSKSDLESKSDVKVSDKEVDKESTGVSTETTSGSSSETILDSEGYFVEENKVLEVGLIAPKFSLENLDLDGKNIKLEDYRGKYVLINFWATWCVYCRDEMPDLQAFGEENRDLAIIAVNVEESRELVEKYINEGGYTFDVALDSDGSLTKSYYISSFPTSIFIDRYGNLIGGVQGLMKKEDMTRVLEYVKEQEQIIKNK